MRRYLGGLALAGFAAVLAGCAPAKELPTDVPSAESGTRDAPAVSAPAASTPEAREVVKRAVTAYTGGKPELLDKGKRHRAKIQVQAFRIDDNGQANEATRAVAAVWPDRFHCTNTGSLAGAETKLEVWLRRPDLVMRVNGLPQQPASPVEFEYNRAADLTGQNWMPLLLPLTDAKAVVFDKRTVQTENRELNLIRLALGDFPSFQLYFDAKTDTLIRCEYSIKDFGVPTAMAVIFSGHERHPSGLLVPRQVEYLRNKQTAERWTIDQWVFPDAIPDEAFSPPVKKK